MQAALELLAPFPAEELLWASPREILNVCQADADRLSYNHGHT